LKIGIIIAMDVEYRKMLDVLGGQPQGSVAGNDVVLWQCGIGKVNAAIGTMRLMQEHRPDCIVSTGLAGGIDDSLNVMDVVVGSQTVYHDVWCGMGNQYGQVQGLPARFDADPLLLHCASAIASGQDLSVKEGLICTGDQFITNRDELNVIKEKYPEGLAVDMESAAIAQVCHLWNVPFLSFRIISDTPGADGHQQQYENFWHEMADRSFGVTHQFLAQIG
jgi:adenosylhomocysteine nucleosidase